MADRIDAEFFQPKYDLIEEHILYYPGGCSKVKDEFCINKNRFHVIKDREYKYVEIGSIDITNGNIFASDLLGEGLPTNAKIKLEEGDVLISKVRPYRGQLPLLIVMTTSEAGHLLFYEKTED